MSATDVPTDLDLDAALERVLARHGELRRQRAGRHRFIAGTVMMALVLGGVGMWWAGRDPGGYEIGSGAPVSSSLGDFAEPSGTSPQGTGAPEHDILRGEPTPIAQDLWRLDRTFIFPVPIPGAPVTSHPPGAEVGDAISVERSVPPAYQNLEGRRLSMRFACPAVGTGGVIDSAYLAHLDGQVVIDVQISSGGGPCAPDGLGVELRVELPFDPGNVHGAIAEDLRD